MVKLLLDKGSSIDGKGSLYGPALNGAAAGSSKAIIEMLLDHGAGLNAEVGDFGSVLQALHSYATNR
jgi:ankyrin repeat protein